MIKVIGICGLALISTLAFADEPEKKPETPEVFITKVKKTELYNPVSFGGFVEAADQRAVGPELSGTVNRVFVTLGQTVKKGQVLFSLRPQGAGQEYRLNQVQSPIDGVVIEVIHDPGKFIQAGEGVVRVADASELKVEINITYDDLELVKPGVETEVKLTNHDKEEVTTNGTVLSVSPSAHPQLGTFPVEVKINCTKGETCSDVFRVGTFVRTVFKSGLREGIKLDAKYLVNQRRKAIILSKGNKAKFVEVKLGSFLGSEVEIVEGLSPGDRVVTNFSKFPKEDEKVKVKDKEQEKKKIYSAGDKDKTTGKS